ncbi:MAG: hypothetical protein N3B21_09650 [Clostridia bacterium]|nr:hypothetical protein [Clostridia bacterium]
MMQKRWFKVFVWFASTSFFFLASGILISELGPEPSEQQTMQFMMGMMDAMHNSMMGLSMSLEHDTGLKQLVGTASYILVPLVILAVLFGLLVRFRGKRNAR